jgi:hypothetical protein
MGAGTMDRAKAGTFCPIAGTKKRLPTVQLSLPTVVLLDASSSRAHAQAQYNCCWIGQGKRNRTKRPGMIVKITASPWATHCLVLKESHEEEEASQEEEEEDLTYLLRSS